MYIYIIYMYIYIYHIYVYIDIDRYNEKKNKFAVKNTPEAHSELLTVF